MREGGAGTDWSSLTPAGGLGTGLGLQLSTTAAEKHPRVHLDLYAADEAEQAAETERLVSLGAERVDWDLYPEDPDFIVLADPEGNRFCIVDTSHADERAWPATRTGSGGTTSTARVPNAGCWPGG